MMKEKPKIFLSYAREDEAQVWDLYQKLSEAGFKPWMDKKDILPGQGWDYCITKAIREADFVLVCLSLNSVNKRGYLQKEIEHALDLRKEKLESDIYLIPIRLQACEVPERLRPWQWVDLFESNGEEKLMQAIKAGIQQREEEVEPSDSSSTNTSAPTDSYRQVAAMKTALQLGKVVRGETSKRHYLVDQFLNSGAQGEMYRCNFEGKAFALKWYFRYSASQEKRETLENLIERRGVPSEKYLWPVEVVSAWNVPGFGYIMSLPESRYKSLVELMARRIEPSFRALATAGFQLAHSFHHLHLKSLCYREISFENVLFDPIAGDILLSDNDNLMIDNDSIGGGVLGTPRFMAPEIVRGEALPRMRTDFHSLAVILFHLFMLHHPLEGKKEILVDALDLPEMARLSRLYGNDPVFIFDPNDDSNRPMPTYHRNALIFWPLYPQFLRDRFTQAFTDGIHDPQNGRVPETVWRDDMVRLRDSIFYCSHCSCENFYDPDTIGKFGNKLMPCWNCKNQPQFPIRIRITKSCSESIVVLNHNTALFPHHINDAPHSRYDFSKPVATVNRHEKNQNLWFLKNLSHEKWTYTEIDGRIYEVEPERSVTLLDGTKIDFGTTTGKISAGAIPIEEIW